MNTTTQMDSGLHVDPCALGYAEDRLKILGFVSAAELWASIHTCALPFPISVVSVLIEQKSHVAGEFRHDQDVPQWL